MQRIINGVGQQVLDTCRCSQCSGQGSNAVRSFGRRTMNARSRRPISSTYWLSGVFAAAATFDAGQKIRRRDQWDEAIAKKKKELTYSTPAEELARVREALALDSIAEQEVQSRATQNLASTDETAENMHYAPRWYTPSEYSHDEPALRTFPGYKSPRPSKVTRVDHKALFLDELENPKHFSTVVNPGGTLLDEALEQEQWPTNTGVTLRQQCLAPESIYLTTKYKSHERSAPSRKKMEIINLATNLLQMNILLHLHDTQSLVDFTTIPATVQDILRLDKQQLVAENRDLFEDLKRVWKATADLQHYQRRTPRLTLARYTAQDRSLLSKSTTLNQRLYSNFIATKKELHENSVIYGQRSPKDDIPAVIRMLANTVDILNSSVTTPDLSTYNILIAGFSDHNLKTLASHTIATLRRCQLRPNETTVSTVLQHYLKYGDEERFDRWIDIFNGQHGGLALSRHNSIRDSHLSQQLKVKHEEVHKVIQLQHASPKVFSAMIAGTLHFHGMEAALEKCRTIGAHSWGMCMDTLGPLLRDCADRCDADNASMLWSMVCELEIKAKHAARSSSRRLSEPVPKHLFAAMLDLHRRTGHQGWYAKIARHAQAVWPGEMQCIININKSEWRLTPGKKMVKEQRLSASVNAARLKHPGQYCLDLSNAKSSDPLQDDAAQEETSVALPETQSVLDVSHENTKETPYTRMPSLQTMRPPRWQDTGPRLWPSRDGMSFYAPEEQGAHEQHVVL